MAKFEVGESKLASILSVGRCRRTMVFCIPGVEEGMVMEEGKGKREGGDVVKGEEG